MEFTLFFAKIVGPVLLVRAVSILFDRDHFVAMIDGMEREISTVSFSFFPVALFMVCTAILAVHTDTSSLAAILIYVTAWGGLVKATALMLFPRLLVKKGQLLAKTVLLNVVLVMCFLVGGYFTWFGYFAGDRG